MPRHAANLGLLAYRGSMGDREGEGANLPDPVAAAAKNRRNAVAGAAAAGVCPACETPIANGAGVGSGSKAEGRFCGITCYMRFNAETIRLRLSEGVQPPEREL